MTVRCPVEATSQTAPDHPAVEVASRTISYLELNTAVRGAVAQLRTRGVSPGDRVAVRLEDGIDFAVALWSIFRLGAVAVILNEHEPGRLSAGAIGMTGCRLLISENPTESPVEVVGPADFVRHRLAASEGEARFDLDALSTIVFTSGSEGRPKAVVHRLKNHWRSAEGSQTRLPVGDSTRWAVVIPKHHVGGLSIFFRCFLHGGTVIVPHRDERNRSGLAKRGVTHVSIVPTQLRDWLANDDPAGAAGLEAILVGGASTPSRVRRAAFERGLPVRFSYGSTEMASQIATTDPNDRDVRPGYAGRVLPFRSVRLEQREILVGGETRFAGYWRDEGLSRPFDEAGWFATGDLGELDGDRLIVTGRADNQFISGGENLYPEEIEEAIMATGLVDVAVVVPAPDERFGARAVAYIRPVCSIADLRAALAGLLPPFKIPKDLRRLPDNMDGSKRDRRSLVKMASAGP